MKPKGRAETDPVSPDDPQFNRGPVPAAAMPHACLENNFLVDQLGSDFTLISFDEKLIETATELDSTHVVLPLDSETATMLSAGPIAARWQNDHDTGRYSTFD